MKALLVSPELKNIEVIDVADVNEIKNLIGFDTIIADEVGVQGDLLYFDEDCFLRGTEGRFQIDTLVPIAGKGVIVGSADDGTTLKDVLVDIDDLSGRIKYL